MFRTVAVFAPGATRSKPQQGHLPCAPMRTRPMILAALTASLTLLVGACSSESDPQPSPTGQTGTSDEDGTAAPQVDQDAVGSTAAPVRGYLCRYITQETQEAVAGRELSDPHQVLVANDANSWVCEARDGDESLVRVSILRGEDAWGTQRALAQEEEGVTEGAEWLGESYQSARRITGLTMCAGQVDGEATYEPYALVLEAVTESDEDVSSALNRTASTLTRSLDQAVGCSPKMARGEISGPTPSS